MKTAKIGAIFLISVLALAGIGVGYAAWTETINIQGTINTGSVDWHFIDYSGTWVYKNLTNDECVVSDTPLEGADLYLVAWSFAEEGDDDHHLVVEFSNIFPCIDFEADATLEYTGTVPGKIYQLYWNDFWPEDANETLLDDVTTIEITLIYPDGNTEELSLSDLCGLQLHQGYKLQVVMTIHIPQDDDYEGIFGDFNLDIGIIQWNEFDDNCGPK
jgi:hypothetical protein